MSFSFKLERPYRIFLNALKILTYNKVQQDVILVFHPQALIMKSNTLSERAQAIFNRQFFDSFTCPEELIFEERTAFVVSSKYLIKALDVPKFVSERIVTLEKESTRTVLWVIKKIACLKVKIKIDITESDESEFNEHSFEQNQTPPLLCMEAGNIRSMHATFRNCVTNLEANILLDIHPSLGVRVKSLGGYEVETFFQRSSFKGQYAPTDRLVNSQRTKLEKGFELKLQLNRFVRVGAMAEMQKHDIRVYAEKLIKEDRSINLAYLVVGSIKNYELLISCNSNLKEKDLTRDDSFKKTQVSSISEHAPSLVKLMQLNTTPKIHEPEFQEPLPRGYLEGALFHQPELEEIKEVKKEDGTPQEQLIKIIQPEAESLEMSNSLPMLAPHEWTMSSHGTKDELQVKKEESDQQNFLMSILLEDDENEESSLYPTME